jgi:vitamin B12 transporter
MIRLFSSISVLALGLATSAAAQTASAPPAADQAATYVSQVVVTATRTPTERLKLADSVTVITAKDIALKQQLTLSDVLNQAPGLNLVQSGGLGAQTSIFMRGTNSNHVKVLVDGIDVSDPSTPTGTFDFGQFQTADIEHVEILRGPQSGLYGSDAIGGVINVITKQGEGAPHLTADVEGGSFDTFNQTVGIGGSTGPFHYQATLAHLSSGSTSVTPLDTLAPGERRNNDAYDNITASAKLGYEVTSTFDLGLVARYTDSHLHSTGDAGFCPPADLSFGFCNFAYPDPVRSETDDKQYYVRGTGRLSLFDGRFDQTLGLAYSNLRTTDITPSGDSWTAPYDSALSYSRTSFYGDRVKADWQGDVKLADTETLVLGAEHQRDEITQPVSAARPPTVSRRPISSPRPGPSWRRASARASRPRR